MVRGPAQLWPSRGAGCNEGTLLPARLVINVRARCLHETAPNGLLGNAAATSSVSPDEVSHCPALGVLHYYADALPAISAGLQEAVSVLNQVWAANSSKQSDLW